VKQFVTGSQLEVQRVVGVGHLKGPIAISQFSHVEDHIRRMFHMMAEVVGELPAGSPTKGITVARCDVQDLIFGPLLPGLMQVRVMIRRHKTDSTQFRAADFTVTGRF
jgi:hypothetical protein